MEAGQDAPRMLKWSQLTSRLRHHAWRGVCDALKASSGAPETASALRHGDGTAHVGVGVERAPNFQRFPGGEEDVSGLGAGDSELLAKFLTEEEADHAFTALCPGGEIEYQQWYHMPDKKKPYEALKRLQRIKVAMADPEDHGLPWYRFPVNDQQRYGILPMSPTVRMLCDRVNKRLNASFNHAVILYYADGNECIGYHKDKTLDLDENSAIVSISLGRPGRPYVLRDDIFNPTTETEVLLPHGGLFKLGPDTNKSFYHAVRQTPTPEIAGARVSVTFRHVTSYEKAGELTGKGAVYPTLNWPLQLNGQHRMDEDLDQALEKPEPTTPTKAPAPVKKAPAPQLSPEDIELLRTCLAEAALEDHFATNDLRGAGLAARSIMMAKVGEAKCDKLSKALGGRIGEAYKTWKKAQKGKPKTAVSEPTPEPPKAKEIPAAEPAVAPTAKSPSWSFGALVSRWIWGEPDPTAQELLDFWFGEQPYKFRGGLWWRGIDPEHPHDGQEGTDKRILDKYGAVIRSCQQGLASSRVASWAETSEGKATLVVLLDQMPRNAFRGTAEMFAYDALAQELAKDLLKAASVPWPHATFAHVALMHSEDVPTVEEAALGLLRLASEVEPHVSNRLKSMHNEAKTHASVLRSFGRYPHRNELLGRTSTAAELTWLHCKHLPTWAQSVRPKFQKKLDATQKEQVPEVMPESSGPKLRILVLHSNRQNATDFKRKTRHPLAPLEAVADLHYLDGPHLYTPMGEALQAVGKMGENAPKNRCWWNSTDDPATMKYVGMEKTLQHVENAFREHGPFDGIIGFSQGGCLAGLLAAMQPCGLIKFNFCVVISGFYCRDVEYCKLMLEDVPTSHREEEVHAKVGTVTIPSFHSWGLEDKLVEPWRSQKLADSFKDPVVVPHKADHFAQGRLHWPIVQIVEWLKETGLMNLAAPPPEPAKQDEKSAWARLMKGSGVASVTQEDVQQVLAEAQSLQQLVDRALALLPWNSKVAQPLAAYWVIAGVAAHPNYEDQASLLPDLLAAGGWKTMVHLYTILEDGEATPASESLQTAVVEFIGKQLSEDMGVVKDWRACDDHKALGMQPAVSQCARYAPRFGGAVRKMALRVAADIHVRTGGQLAEDLRQQQPELSVMYRKLLSDIIALLDEFSEAGLAHQKGDRRSQWRLGGLDLKTFGELRASPLSDAVLYPEPMPVDVSSKEEMSPLYQFLNSGGNFEPNINDDLVFTKGTITRDKRLDLCKQVIGPQGVEDLMQALHLNQSAGLVQHLLIGNNICGNDLPRRMAENIREGKVSLNTLYLAGNRITADGLAPLCSALRDDRIVHQLWLKRNPLHKDGAVVLAELLHHNRTLQVLDLVNCGLMDEGAEAIVHGLEGSSSLKHLYLDGNGLTAKSAAAVTKAGTRLETLSLGMNRLSDEGTAAVTENLSPTVSRLCLAAVGMGVPGAKAIAEMLKTNSTLRFLDLGLLKATGALKEVPNRITDEGTEIIAAALEQNTSLNAMLLVHNTIHQAGIKALQVAMSKHPSMVKLELEQLGIPFNELTREEIRHCLATNRRKLQEDPAEWARVQEALDPKHLEEIKSVYRMGNTYSPGPGADPDLW